VVPELEAFLRERGATEADIDQAEAEGWLPLLAFDRVLALGTPRYDAAALADRAGSDVQTARTLWRSLGFPDGLAGRPVFSDGDVEALRLALRRAERARGRLAHQTKIISSSLARIAAVEAEVGEMALAELRASGLPEDEVALRFVERMDWIGLQSLIDYVHRVQLRAAIWRRLGTAAADVAVPDVGIGFADLSGYSALSSELEPDALDALLDRWEDLAYDLVAAAGASVVKTVGDEVMFAGPPVTVARVACELSARAAAAAGLPDVRVGVACGPVLAREGDYYGRVVNVASRLAELAPPQVVLADEALAAAVGAEPGLVAESVGPHHLRGIGTVEVSRLR